MIRRLALMILLLAGPAAAQVDRAAHTTSGLPLPSGEPSGAPVGDAPAPDPTKAARTAVQKAIVPAAKARDGVAKVVLQAADKSGPIKQDVAPPSSAPGPPTVHPAPSTPTVHPAPSTPTDGFLKIAFKWLPWAVGLLLVLAAGLGVGLAATLVRKALHWRDENLEALAERVKGLEEELAAKSEDSGVSAGAAASALAAAESAMAAEAHAQQALEAADKVATAVQEAKDAASRAAKAAAAAKTAAGRATNVGVPGVSEPGEAYLPPPSDAPQDLDPADPLQLAATVAARLGLNDQERIPLLEDIRAVAEGSALADRFFRGLMGIGRQRFNELRQEAPWTAAAVPLQGLLNVCFGPGEATVICPRPGEDFDGGVMTDLSTGTSGSGSKVARLIAPGYQTRGKVNLRATAVSR